MKTKLIIIARWIGVIPTFALAYVLVYAIMYFSYNFWADEDSWAIKYWLPVFGSLVSGIFSIVYACKIAPSYKSTVAS